MLQITDRRCQLSFQAPSWGISPCRNPRMVVQHIHGCPPQQESISSRIVKWNLHYGINTHMKVYTCIFFVQGISSPHYLHFLCITTFRMFHPFLSFSFIRYSYNLMYTYIIEFVPSHLCRECFWLELLSIKLFLRKFSRHWIQTYLNPLAYVYRTQFHSKCGINQGLIKRGSTIDH
jgi:hypothetical protein